jgi:hypothetical protein
MHLPLLARTCSPTFYLYRRTIFLSHKIKYVKNIRVKFKTLRLHYLCKIKCYKALSSLQHVYFAFGTSWQSCSLKATGYQGYNLSIHLEGRKVMWGSRDISDKFVGRHQKKSLRTPDICTFNDHFWIDKSKDYDGTKKKFFIAL